MTKTRTLALLGFSVICATANNAWSQSPLLQISVTNGNALLSWNGSNLVVQTTAALQPTVHWQNLSLPLALGGTQELSLPMTSAQSFYRLVYSPFLPPPTGLEVIAETDQFFLSWDAVTNAVSYRLYGSTTPGAGPHHYDFLQIGITNPSTVVTGLTAGVVYFMRVTAENGAGESATSAEVSDVFGPQAEIKGSVYTLVEAGTNTIPMFLAGVQLYLTNLAGSTLAATAVTDGGGQFTFAAQPVGAYLLCWQAAHYMPGCSTQQITIVDQLLPQTVYLAPEYIQPDTNAGTALLYGTVTFSDGSAIEAHDPFFDINVQPTVVVRGISNLVAGFSRPNAQGQYLIPGLGTGTNYTIAATVEAAQVQTNLVLAGTTRLDLTIPNSPPFIQRISTTISGQPVRRAAPGQQVLLTATAADNDATDTLHYAWFAGTETTNFTSVDSSNVLWTVPQCDGLPEMYVRVNDGKGGYATAKFAISTSSGWLFTGQVLGNDYQITTNADSTLATNAPPVTNALVSINGETTSTDDAGYFSLNTTNGASAFVLCIQHTNYAPLTRVFTEESSGAFELQRAQQIVTNYFGQALDLADASNSTIHIQAGSLATANGAPIQNPLTVFMTTMNPCSAAQLAVPDNVTLNNTNYLLQFLSALDVRIVDSASNDVVLLPGTMADVVLATAPSCIVDPSNLPPSSPAWRLSPCSSNWIAGATDATLFSVGGSAFYSFSTAALGLLAAAGPQQQVKLRLDIDKTIPITVDVLVSGKGFAELKTIFERGSDESREVYSVPANAQVKVQLFNPREAPGDSWYDKAGTPAIKTRDQKIVIVELVTNTGNADLTVPLSLSQHLPKLTLARIRDDGQFLTRGVPANAGQIVEEGNAYYKAIHADGIQDLKGWQVQNGFINPANPATLIDDQGAIFFNATDLGFGRSMHMRTRANAKNGGTDVAYFVSNHPRTEEAIAGKNLIATVAMDYAYDPIYERRFTKFYVFNDQNRLVGFADLDGVGAKAVPNLCIVCHGGKQFNYRPADKTFSPKDGDLGSQFLPFDPASYTYDPTLPQPKLLQAFDKLNSGIKLTSPSKAVAALVDGLKGNGFKTWFPNPGWQAPAPTGLYRDVMAVSCRACHVTRANLEFDVFADFDSISKINGKNLNKTYPQVAQKLRMPNSLRTFSVFWGSATANVLRPGCCPNQPDLLKAQFGWPNALADKP